MSMRCIWVVSLSKDDFGQILLYRAFPTVEKRCKIVHAAEYVPLPMPNKVVNRLLVQFGLTKDSKQYVEWRDKPCNPMQLPVVEVCIDNKEIWPVVAIVQRPFLVSCLPFVETNIEEHKKELLHIPSVSVGFSVLLAILNFLHMVSNTEKVSQLTDLDNLLTICMPFGTPSDVELSCASYLYNHHSHNFLKRQPAWKPFDYKGKQQVHLRISECVRCMQSDHSGTLCHVEIFGEVSVKADLEGTKNDVTLSVTGSDVSHPLLLDSLIIHPCVEIHTGPTASGSALLRRLRFSPPLHKFTLFNYCFPEPKEPPIFGVFKMLGENLVELMLQLKLNDKMKNNFEFCDVIIVFFNRGPIKTFEFNTNHGSPKLSDDKHSLKWSIGTKFPKDLETIITAKLAFHEKPLLPHNDPFCVDKNCYAQINFRQNNTTLSGCNIDPKTVTVSQGSKIKVVIDRTFESTEYRIWNNYGDLPFPVNILNKYKNISS